MMHSASSVIVTPSKPLSPEGSTGSLLGGITCSLKKPPNPHVSGHSASDESSATCSTSLSHSSSRMDWTITSHNENSDQTSDGDDDCTDGLTSGAPTNMKLVPEETTGPVVITKQQSVEFEVQPKVHDFEEREPENKRPVPTSVQIHRAISPSSPSSRIRRSEGGTLRRSVSFHQVQIRRYPMIAGDNPACQMGAPVTLDWGFEELPALDLDDFESTRSRTRRRKLHHLILNYFQRNRILAGMGYTEEEIKQTEKEANRERFKRDLTKLMMPISKIEEVIQSIRRKMKRKMNKAEQQGKDELDDSIRMLRQQDLKRLSELSLAD